eukprot:CAMPEP_0179119668 /NCGR_PEP_ID=MMETSP0796-20121207/56346_1 /TAXON_ID=73915 /ORGANISM="Pyrodinium bahamense, Strain pbaha01" /LENGTH=477 /DNA_ID=CAMNT_0020818181 /DNA_START=13 /DNA_END=1443 /DNA_ORIENTATION=-
MSCCCPANASRARHSHGFGDPLVELVDIAVALLALVGGRRAPTERRDAGQPRQEGHDAGAEGRLRAALRLGVAEHEGRELEEAVQRAPDALGHDVALQHAEDGPAEADHELADEEGPEADGAGLRLTCGCGGDRKGKRAAEVAGAQHQLGAAEGGGQLAAEHRAEGHPAHGGHLEERIEVRAGKALQPQRLGEVPQEDVPRAVEAGHHGTQQRNALVAADDLHRLPEVRHVAGAAPACAAAVALAPAAGDDRKSSGQDQDGHVEGAVNAPDVNHGAREELPVFGARAHEVGDGPGEDADAAAEDKHHGEHVGEEAPGEASLDGVLRHKPALEGGVQDGLRREGEEGAEDHHPEELDVREQAVNHVDGTIQEAYPLPTPEVGDRSDLKREEQACVEGQDHDGNLSCKAEAVRPEEHPPVGNDERGARHAQPICQQEVEAIVPNALVVSSFATGLASHPITAVMMNSQKATVPSIIDWP